MNLEKLQKVIEDIGDHIPPGDDWMPALIVEGEKEVTIYGFAGDLTDNTEMKDWVAGKITELIAEFKPNVACFITTAWSIDFKEGDQGEVDIELYTAGLIKISEHPDRVEIVNAYIYSVSGPDKGETLMMGTIQRHPDKGPSITKWKVIREEGITAEGRFPDAVKQGFKQAGLMKGVT